MKRRDIKDCIKNIKSSTSEKFEKMSSKEERVPYDERTNNGFIFYDEHYIPEEILSNILSYYVDYKTLCSCQLVCKQWNLLMKNYVWRKKAELMLQHTLPLDDDTPWTSYYLICHKRPFNRNLIKNHSGQKMFSPGYDWNKSCIRKCNHSSCSQLPHYQIGKDLNCDWKIIRNYGSGWAVEKSPIGVPPLPDDPVFEEYNCCFVTSFGKNWKQQDIDLVKEGISEYILDHGQPSITVSEWFSCRDDCGAVYACSTELIAEENVILSHFNYTKRMINEEQYQWFKFEHEFKNYGKGFRKIRFGHGGEDVRTWGGHYGSKMAGACIKLAVPSSIPKEAPAAQEQPTSVEPYYKSAANLRETRCDFEQEDDFDSDEIDSEEYISEEYDSVE